MNNTDQKIIANDEVKFSDYWEEIKKKKWLLITLFTVITLGTLATHPFLPKIYRGDFIISVQEKDFIHVFKTIKIEKVEVKENIFPNTNQLIDNIKLTHLSDTDTIDYRFQIQIDARDTSDIPKIASELFKYIGNFPFYKKFVEHKKELQTKELNELSKTIKNMESEIETYKISLDTEKKPLSDINLAAIHNGILDLVKRKTILQESLKNDNGGIEVILNNVYRNPVKPHFTGNLIKALISSFLLSLFIIYFSAQFKKNN